MGKVRENLDACTIDIKTYKFDIDKLMSNSTQFKETIERHGLEITETQKSLAVV